jgi:hypothetical protein
MKKHGQIPLLRGVRGVFILIMSGKEQKYPICNSLLKTEL